MQRAVLSARIGQTPREYSRGVLRCAARCHNGNVPSYKPRVVALFLTFAVLLFLWLAPLQLFFAALLAALHRPQLLAVLLPNTPVARALFLNTVTMAIGTSVLAVIFGAPCGIAMARGPKALRGVFTVLCALPLALPPLLFATVWLALTHLASPRMQASLAAVHTTTIPPVLMAAPLLALCFYPVVAFAVRAALLSISPDAENAARLHGGSFSVWRRVLWPLLMPAVWGAAGLVAALAMWEMPAPDLLDARTYAVQIYMSLNDADGLDISGKAVKIGAAIAAADCSRRAGAVAGIARAQLLRRRAISGKNRRRASTRKFRCQKKASRAKEKSRRFSHFQWCSRRRWQSSPD